MSTKITINTAPIAAQDAPSIPLRELIKGTLEHYFRQLDGTQPANLYELVLEEVELPLFQIVMDLTGGNQSKAAEHLGISRGTLRKKLKHHKLDQA
jgi:Fis family transcriptional regulator, factor for inversion stimulation protein